MVNQCYEQAQKTGLYMKPAGLKGKYDNVRRFWEDEITCRFLKPYLQELCTGAASRKQGIRILDLGCGSGDGYELLLKTAEREASLAHAGNTVCSEDLVDAYVGIDINPGLLEQGRADLGDRDKVIFRESDFSGGLPVEEGEKPFDIYMGTYGTFSHCSDQTAVDLLAGAAGHANPGALVIADWLGWHAYEWQNLWTEELQEDQVMQYVISYLVDKNEDRPEPFALRLMNKKTVENLVESASERARRKLRILSIFDRSVFVGRHMETGEYNNTPQPLRSAVNSLLEPETRTDLGRVYVNCQPRDGFPAENKYFSRLSCCWNELVKYARDLMEGKGVFPPGGPPVLQRAAFSMQQLVAGVEKLDLEDARANIIEPQLAFQLRGLEEELQEGEGRAHSIVAVLRVE